MDPLVEAVPNFSEGRDRGVIDRIASALDRGGARVLHVDPNPDAHRTVVTLAGPLSAVLEALRAGISTALEAIDMRQHRGAHLRIGAADVVPLVPLVPGPRVLALCIRGVAELAEQLAVDCSLPIWLYERSALRPRFASLPRCRRGGYEALADRFEAPGDGPDLGPRAWGAGPARTGGAVLGVRDLLVAMNFTLDSRDEPLARSLAAAIRSAGPGGRPDRLEALRAVGWTMPGYEGRVQVSTNLLDPRVTSAGTVLQTLRRLAAPVEVLGAELIGLCPARVLADAALQARDAELPSWPAMQVLDSSTSARSELLVEGVQALGLRHLGGGSESQVLSERLLEWKLADADLWSG